MESLPEKLLFEIYKNFKLIFRNWSSLALIILAPLILILLVGYSFSGDDLHDINIGIVADSNIDLADFSQNVSDFAEIKRYQSEKACKIDLALEELHICLEITGSFTAKEGEIPTGQVRFYYDNTRKKISLLLLTEIKEYFGLTSEKISLASTQVIFDNLQSLLDFLNERIDDIDKIKNESELIRTDLIQRKAKLIQVRDDFTPKYQLVKSTQSKIEFYAASFIENSSSLIVSIEDLKNITTKFRYQMNATNLSFLENTTLNLALSLLEKEIDNTVNITNTTVIELTRIKDSLDSVVIELDNINELLNEEINRTDDYILLINRSLNKIETISGEAKDKMEDLTKIDPSLAAKIIKPITQSFESLVQDIKDIQLAFPVLLSTVIIFISLLFSNIISLLEINNKAYTRNILAPVDDLLFTSGMVITNFIIIFFQVIVLLIVAEKQFAVDISSHISTIIPIVIVLILTFIFLGMIIAYFSKSMQTSILLSTFVALGFFLFSNALNALEAMPKLAASIVAFNPVVIVNTMFRKILFFDLKLSQLSADFYTLVLYMIVAAILLVLVSKRKNKQRF